jgi:arsenical pump membrane protein
VWLVAALLGTLTVLTGLLSPNDAGSVATRVAPVLVFLVAFTVLAELTDAAGVFDAAATRAARVARGRTPVLFGLVVLLATTSTVLLSLDTTAVLVTPVVLTLVQRLELNPIPFALAAVWLANTASLLLPVSNLTNLLAVGRLRLSTPSYLMHLALPALAAVVVTTVFLALWQRKSLIGRYDVPTVRLPEDPVLFAGAAAACLLLVPTLLLGVPVAWAAGTSASLLLVLFGVRRRSALRLSLIPWRLVVLVLGLFLVVEAIGPLGLDDVLRRGIGSPLQTAFVGAAGANVVNNLPAYLAMERVVPHDQLLALLLGVNLGPLVTPWGSLATLLWADRCRARGVHVGWLRFSAAGLLLVPLLLLATTPLTT